MQLISFLLLSLLFYLPSYAATHPAMAIIQPCDKIITDILEANVSVDTSIQNIDALYKKKVDFAIIDSHHAQMIDGSMPRIRVIAALYPKMLAFISNKESNITSFSQIKEKKLRIKLSSTSTQTLCKLMLSACDIQHNFPISTFSNAKTMLINGELDAMFTLVGHPDSRITQLAKKHNITFIPLFGKKFDQLNNNYPFIIKGGMPKGIYKGLEHDIKSLGVKALLVTREDVNESIVFKITKRLLDQLGTIKTADPIYRGISKKSLLEGLVLPQHIGATKAFNAR